MRLGPWPLVAAARLARVSLYELAPPSRLPEARPPARLVIYPEDRGADATRRTT